MLHAGEPGRDALFDPPVNHGVQFSRYCVSGTGECLSLLLGKTSAREPFSVLNYTNYQTFNSIQKSFPLHRSPRSLSLGGSDL